MMACTHDGAHHHKNEAVFHTNNLGVATHSCPPLIKWDYNKSQHPAGSAGMDNNNYEIVMPGG